jgi:ElaB/YqjD/DUF883 family membrane-anchored ribosome-binding protein
MTSASEKTDFKSLSKEFDRFQDEVGALKSKLTKLATDTIEDIQNNPAKLLDLRSSIEQKITLLEDDVSQFGQYLKEQGAEAVGTMSKQISERPVTTIAVAFGLGFVAAQLVRRL